MPGLWLPEWLYRLLPLTYLVCGVLIFNLFGDETTGQLSAVLLWAAAFLIWRLRLHARREAARRKT